MFYLLLAVFSSAMISITMRASSGKVKSHHSMLAANYLVCSILGAIYAPLSLLTPQTPEFSLTIGLGILNGVILLAGLILLQTSTQKNGIVLSSIFMKLGLLVPFLVSILFFQEIPTGLQIAGFCVATCAIVLINLKQGNQVHHFGIELVLLLLINGSADTLVKVFEALGPADFSDHFLFCSFIVAFLLCTALVIRNKEHFDGKALLFGALIGICNFFSFKFLIGALAQLPAVVVFPSFSVATMLVVMLGGVLFFREKLDKRQWLAFGAVIAALVMLNI